ncbi:MAG: insulinase family protein [Kiritimatiellae bacterium]|nr:insulinase family protein [Kiritimatiellia bacterium]
MKSVIPEITVRKDVKQAQLAIGFRTFGVEDKRIFVFTVLVAIMGRGMSSRLFVEVREKRGLSYDISSRFQAFHGHGMWAISAGVDVAKKDVALKVILKEIDRIRTRKVSAAELKRVKEFLTGNFKLAHERVISKLFYHGSTLLSFGRLIPTEEQIAAVKAVTADDILFVAQEVLKDDVRAISWVLPNEEK